MWPTQQSQELRRIGDWCFHSNGWWYSKGVRACFFTDVNVPTGCLALVEWMIGDQIHRNYMTLNLNRPLAGFNKVNEEEMLFALNEVKKSVKTHCQEV